MVYIKDIPGLLDEWDFDKNSIDPFILTYGSGKKAWWLCEKCNHSWKTEVRVRAKYGCGCPGCVNLVPTIHRNLFRCCPDVAGEWDYKKNDIKPNEVSPRSHKVVWWICSESHSWKAPVGNRVSKEGKVLRGCPVCSNRILTEQNSLRTVLPQLADEWVTEKNGKLPEEIVAGGAFHAYWRCSKCQHEWKTSVDNRVSKGSGCPRCSMSTISPISQKWLDVIGVPKEFREYKIKCFSKRKYIRVDGFDPETNTVYEFLGDYWHGNLDVYDYGEVNKTVGKTFGQLNRETLDRLNILQNTGYRVVYIWEKDFKEENEVWEKKY